MTLAGKVFRTIVMVMGTSSLLVACAPQNGMRSYRYDLTKYKAIQEKLHRQLEADSEKDSSTPTPAPTPAPVPDEAPDAGLNGGSLPSDSQAGGSDEEQKPKEPEATPAEEVNPEVQGQNIIETAVNEQIEGKTLSVESLDKLFDASKAQDAVLGLSANVTLLEGKMDIAFHAIAAPMKNSKEFSGAASPTLQKAGIANKILFAEVTGAETDGDTVSTQLVGTLLCRDADCHDMIGMLVVEPNLMVVFKVDSTGKVEGPFKTFEEASEELAKSKAALENSDEASKKGEQQMESAPKEEASGSTTEVQSNQAAETSNSESSGQAQTEQAQGQEQGQETETVDTATDATATQNQKAEQAVSTKPTGERGIQPSVRAKSYFSSETKPSGQTAAGEKKTEIFRYNDKINEKGAKPAVAAKSYFSSQSKMSDQDSDLAAQKAAMAAVRSGAKSLEANKTKTSNSVHSH